MRSGNFKLDGLIMINLIFMLVLSIVSFKIHASDSYQESPDFSYQQQAHPILDKFREKSLKELDQFFEQQELSRIFINLRISEKKISLESMDRIYSGDLGETVIFVKTGVNPSLKRLIDEIVSIDDGFLAHYVDQSGLVMAVFIKSSHWESVSDIFSDLRQKYQKVTYQKNIFEFISSTYAEDDCANCERKSQAEITIPPP
jgi:hypothetical protein